MRARTGIQNFNLIQNYFLSYNISRTRKDIKEKKIKMRNIMTNLAYNARLLFADKI